MHQSVEDAFVPFSGQLEGVLGFMYLDVKRLVTTGMGNLIDADSGEHFGTNAHLTPDAYGLGWENRRDGHRASREEIDEEYRKVKFSETHLLPVPQRKAITTLELKPDAIQRLIASKLHEVETRLKRRSEFASFDEWPADAQLGLLSMAWALGAAFRFPNFQAAVKRGDWMTAAFESHMSEAGNPGVVPRNVRNGLLFTIAAWMAAPPPGTFSVLVFNPAISLADNMRADAFPVPLNLDIGIQAALERASYVMTNPDYDPRGLDGVFGPGTRAALTKFQHDVSVPQTPNAKHVADVGEATVDALATVLDNGGIAHIR